MKTALVLLVILTGCGLKRAPQDRIAISGNIEMTEVTIAFKTAGKLIERPVDEGDAVKRGMIVARLDRDQLERQREREQAGLEAAQAQLATAQTALAWQRQSTAADIAQRRADLAATQARYQEVHNGSRPQEIQEARAAVEAAQTEHDRARRDWERAQTLYKNDDISTAQHDQFRSRYETTAAALKQARERLELIVAGPRAEVREAAQAQVQRAQASLRAGEANELEIRRRQQEIAARRAEIDRAKAQIALLDTQLADTVATTPVDGIVLVKTADVGEVLAPGSPVMTVGDMDHPWLRGYINETDLGRVKIGAAVNVRTDSFPGKIYRGRISFISPQAEFTPKQIQTSEERVKLVYRVKIEIENPNHELKSNMPADAEILLQ